ncbi:ANGPTL1 [Branchiostoma lanceolatum]|uniref:ANGPTL1 protein n=3 Tax=Branchiostoma lanceolatum TaxID=7740 RepID=A0A8J9ZIT0_BRALA|nr:ANGPTL1 [Branchiostoma lanceolatum]
MMGRLRLCLNFCLAAVLLLSLVLGQTQAMALSLAEDATPQNYSLSAEIVNVVCKANCGTDNSTAKLSIHQLLINELCEQAQSAGLVHKGDECQPAVPDVMPLLTDCSKIFRYLEGVNGIPSGPWRIKPDNMKASVEVYCEMTADHGGWTVIQNRFDGSINFYRRIWDYRYGFGDIAGEHWLGLQVLHELTGGDTNYELRVELEDWGGNTAWAKYSEFKIAGERDDYKLTVCGYQGNASDSFVYNSDCKFSTRQHDKDSSHGSNCAEEQGGGWWYCHCNRSGSNLNGPYFRPEHYRHETRTGLGVYWKGWKKHSRHSLKATRMMIRPSDFLDQITK